MHKPAITRTPIHKILEERWSPRAFSAKAISEESLTSLFEAARWAASGNNVQPWRFIVASQDQPEAFAKMADCLVPSNKRWAEKAPVLVAVVVERQAPDAEQANDAAEYAVGLAVASLTLEASSRGIYSHQMGGIDRDKLQQSYHIPEGYYPRVVIALGYLGDIADLPENLQQRELAQRTRKPLEELVFAEDWGLSAKLAQG